MATFSLENFRESVLGLGLARKNRFDVEIQPPPALGSGSLISLFCESAVLPELTINAEMQQIWGPAHHRPKSIAYGGFMVLQFHLDREMNIKKLFDRWMQSIVDGNQYTVSYQRDYIAPVIKVTQLDENNDETYSVIFEEAFPAGMTQLDLSHSLQASTHLLQVNFRFRKWSSNNPGGAFTNNNPVNNNSLINRPSDNFVTVTGDPNQNIGGNTINPLGAGA